MLLHSQVSSDGTTLTIKVQGRFDFSSLEMFRNAYEEIKPKPKKFIIDFEDTDYIDSSVLGMLLALRAYAGEDEADISIINCPEDIKRILVTTKMNEVIKLENIGY